MWAVKALETKDGTKRFECPINSLRCSRGLIFMDCPVSFRSVYIHDFHGFTSGLTAELIWLNM